MAPPVPPAVRPKSYLVAITLSALLILAGGAWLIDLSGIADVDVAIVFALALTVIGIALLASAWFGRARGLIALGIVLAFVVAGFGVIDVPLRGGIGDPTYRPHRLAAVDGSYELAIGKMVVDLRDVDFSGHHRSVHASVGVGDLDVLVPEGVRVVVDGHAGAGSVSVFGRRTQTCCPTDIRRVTSRRSRSRHATDRRRGGRGHGRDQAMRSNAMDRHDLNPVALVFGALFTTLGLAYAVGHWSWFDLNGGWALAVLLIALGLAGVLSSSLRARERSRASAQTLGGPMVDATGPKSST